jgi:hypothetical protein
LAKKTLMVPFSTGVVNRYGGSLPAGSLLNYTYWDYDPERPSSDPGVEWRENYEFNAILTLVDYDHGRSRLNMIWVDAEGRRYSMFMSHAFKLLKRASYGVVAGHWTFCKQGSNYSLKPAD